MAMSSRYSVGVCLLRTDTVDVSINEINQANTFPYIGGRDDNNSTAIDQNLCTAHFTSNTNLRLTCGSSMGQGITIGR
jgi:hypothetical protein